ncbi:MAG: ATP-dependent metallopeptidase FtsH/Yme1/Tma family protein [Gammaproteobacteria bacterium]|nr:ATP-dependent metallopeptidase FtsH/Yme1/Tma family protein [Gammaproteobacteria bacterium]MYF53458.1 ATP-dependent metallopeptidase FtsH/Yme1/Tma family protein [Gammaproteobacteria bacterium]MYK42661.1 ATP-dependent metallopeptidase FtsH/Yme1/Tma family protein [Gammaproteobacteria bacterium]
MAKNLILWVVVALVLLMLFNNFVRNHGPEEISYSEFTKLVETGDIGLAKVNQDSRVILGERKIEKESFKVVIPEVDRELIDKLVDSGARVDIIEPRTTSFWSQLIIAVLPIVIILAIIFFMMRQVQGVGGRNSPLSFGKSRAKLLNEENVKTTFDDVAGVEEAKEDVRELVEFLRDPGKFQVLGGRIPRGTLLVGAPGTGKTLLAKAIAGEGRVPFYTISGSDFVEMFVGVGAARVRDMFAQAKKHSPCIVFIDEIDAVGRHRGAGLGNGHDEREQTLNQLLVEMDGFEANDGVVVIAATNRPDVLDPALTRPGRFDRQVVVPLPDIRGREQILKVHMRKVPLAEDVSPLTIARGTPGFSGADLENVVNEAALFGARASRRLVGMDEFEKAKDKIMMGSERKSMVMSEKEKLVTAYHEAGHAIVGYTVPEHDMLYKITVVPRGRALGVTMFLPEEDKYSLSKTAVESQICSLYGGRIAEELIYGKESITTGASNDIEKVTQLARNMVTKWGFSKNLGALTYDENGGEVFLGKSAATQSNTVSEDTAQLIDQEVREIVSRLYDRAREILVENMDKLHMMAEALMEYETLSPEQVGDIMAGAKPRAPAPLEESSPPSDLGAEPTKEPSPFTAPAEET